MDVLPQYPYSEQQMPKSLPWHVWPPAPPHLPSRLMLPSPSQVPKGVWHPAPQ